MRKTRVWTGLHESISDLDAFLSITAGIFAKAIWNPVVPIAISNNVLLMTVCASSHQHIYSLKEVRLHENVCYCEKYYTRHNGCYSVTNLQTE